MSIDKRRLHICPRCENWLADERLMYCPNNRQPAHVTPTLKQQFKASPVRTTAWLAVGIPVMAIPVALIVMIVLGILMGVVGFARM